MQPSVRPIRVVASQALMSISEARCPRDAQLDMKVRISKLPGSVSHGLPRTWDAAEQNSQLPGRVPVPDFRKPSALEPHR
jgi:hypothetical protein